MKSSVIAFLLQAFDDVVPSHFICSVLFTCHFSFMFSLLHQSDFPLSHAESPSVVLSLATSLCLCSRLSKCLHPILIV